MDELKNILRTALSTVEEIAAINTPERTKTSPITRQIGSDVNAVTGSTGRTRTSPLVGNEPRRTQSLLSLPTVPAALPVAQAEVNFRYRIVYRNVYNII